MGATASREPTDSPADVFWGGRRDQQLGLTHTHMSNSGSTEEGKGDKRLRDGTSHSEAGFKEGKKCSLVTCVKKFGNIIFKIFFLNQRTEPNFVLRKPFWV